MERNKILIADDAELNRDILKFIFEEQYEIIEAEDGVEAINAIVKYQEAICLIFLDLMMPRKSGLDVLEYMRESGFIKTIPIIMITGESTNESDEKAYEYGVSDIIYKPFYPNVVMRRAVNIIELFERRINLEKELEERTSEQKKSQQKLKRSNEFLINALSSVVEFRSLETGEHIVRVKYFTGLLLKYLRQMYPEYKITDEQEEMIINAAAMHDIGKIAIPDSILLKPAKLTEEEFEEVKKHTTYGCELIERFKQEDDDEFYSYCYDICRSHHEKYDGNGYPDGLKGEEIPIWAQIVSLVDAFDALVSKRVYKAPYAVDEAIRMIEEGECGVFSPKILDCFNLAKAEMLNAIERDLSYVDSRIE